MAEPLVAQPYIAWFRSRTLALEAARKVPARRISLRHDTAGHWSVLVDWRAWLRTDGSVS